MNTPLSASHSSQSKPTSKPNYGPDADLQATPQVSPVHQLFLAIDYGQKRTGLASGNRLTCSATPQGSVKASGEAQLTQVVQRVKEWQPDALVIGIPFHPDGVAHENTARARRFAQALRERTRLTVYEVDERYSTTEALSQGTSNADAASAAIILEQFLRSLP